MKKFFIAAILISFALVKANGECSKDQDCKPGEKCEVVCTHACSPVCEAKCVKKTESKEESEEITIEPQEVKGE